MSCCLEVHPCQSFERPETAWQQLLCTSRCHGKPTAGCPRNTVVCNVSSLAAAGALCTWLCWLHLPADNQLNHTMCACNTVVFNVSSLAATGALCTWLCWLHLPADNQLNHTVCACVLLEHGLYCAIKWFKQHSWQLFKTAAFGCCTAQARHKSA
jgi:hypothetical protein